jgi:predicted HTH domain antitoxin
LNWYAHISSTGELGNLSRPINKILGAFILSGLHEISYSINIYVCNYYLLNTNMGTTITTRVSEDLEKKIEKISHIEHLDKSAVIRRLLSNAVQEWLIDHVLMQYQQGKITIGRAARMVGIPLREMIAIASKKGIPFQYSLDDLREDFQAAENI